MQYRPTPAALVIAALVVLMGALAGYRLAAIGYDTAYLLPQRVWEVRIEQRVSGEESGVELNTFLPSTGPRQQVLEDRNSSPGFDYVTGVEGGNRTARWRSQGRATQGTAVYEARVSTRALRFELSRDLKLPETAAVGHADELAPTADIQSAAREIVELSDSLVPEDRSLVGFLEGAFDYVQGFGFKPFKGTTSAITALRLKEASCNGRSRLLVALLRAQKIPARLVGGVVLSSGNKRTSHQWVEALIAGRWVPFDALNHHFAELPANYLELYRGDYNLFRHTAGIGFDYQFVMKPHLVPPATIAERKGALGLWAIFSELGIPLELMRILLMIPIGAMVIVIFRNVVGLKTFGTFLPTLIAAASFNTGFWWGAVGFVALILLTALVRRLIAPLQLLHSPQLAILLTSIVALMIALTFVGASTDAVGLTRITLFPIAVLAITSERYVLMEIEEGRMAALKTLATTLVVVFFCYIVMQSVALQLLFMAFPELLLGVVAIDIYLGRWLGLRVTEWARFKGIVGSPEAAA